MSHGDYFDEQPERYVGPELLFYQDGPFMGFDLKDGYYYGQLATGRFKERWVRLAASPVDMGLIRE